MTPNLASFAEELVKTSGPKAEMVDKVLSHLIPAMWGANIGGLMSDDHPVAAGMGGAAFGLLGRRAFSGGPSRMALGVIGGGALGGTLGERMAKKLTSGDQEKTSSPRDVLRALAIRAAPGAAVGAGVGAVRGTGNEGIGSGAAKGAIVGALLGVPLSHGADRIGRFAGKHLAAREVVKQIGNKPYHKLTGAQRKAFIDAIGEGARPAQDLSASKLKRAGALGAGVTGGVMATRNK